jgi:hypothetical protein
MSILGTLQPHRPHRAHQTFDLDDALSSSRYDEKSETNFYTREDYAGQRSTVKINNYEFDRDCGPLTDESSKARRRQYVAQRLLLGTKANETTADDSVAGFSPIAERNAGLDRISPTRLEAYLNDIVMKITSLTRQVNDLTRGAKLED